MYFNHLINGKEIRAATFAQQMFFSSMPEPENKIYLPKITPDDAGLAVNAVKTALIPPLEERLALGQQLQDYAPSSEALHIASASIGMPRSWVRQSITDGKKMVRKLLSYDSPTSKKTTFVGVSPNDPREIFFFLGHVLLAGSPLILKLSSREPAIGYEVVKFLQERGLPPGLVNVIYGNSSDPAQAELVRQIAKQTDIPIVMGDAALVPNQISFYAEHSRGLVLDAERVLPHLLASVQSPLSCLAEHNYIVVGQDQFEKVVQGLISAYKSLIPGDLDQEATTLGRIDSPTITQLRSMLEMGFLFDSAHLLYSREGAVSRDFSGDISRGLVVQHFSEDYGTGSNPLLTSPLPGYITAIRQVKDIKSAVMDLNAACSHLRGNKSMALGVYGELPKEWHEKMSELAHDVHFNESPLYVKGMRHQGINLNEVLTK